jgi:hypothetical protein
MPRAGPSCTHSHRQRRRRIGRSRWRRRSASNPAQHTGRLSCKSAQHSHCRAPGLERRRRLPHAGSFAYTGNQVSPGFHRPPGSNYSSSTGHSPMSRSDRFVRWSRRHRRWGRSWPCSRRRPGSPEPLRHRSLRLGTAHTTHRSDHMRRSPFPAGRRLGHRSSRWGSWCHYRYRLRHHTPGPHHKSRTRHHRVRRNSGCPLRGTSSHRSSRCSSPASTSHPGIPPRHRPLRRYIGHIRLRPAHRHSGCPLHDTWSRRSTPGSSLRCRREPRAPQPPRAVRHKHHRYTMRRLHSTGPHLPHHRPCPQLGNCIW